MICEEVADKVLRFPARSETLPPRCLSRATLYASLERAKVLLAAQMMTPADVIAWMDLNELQEQLLRQS
jgi:hypothetical protein